MITLDITLLIHILNMVVLMFALNVVLYKPVQNILQQRRDRLDSLNKEVEQFEENARHRQQEVDRKIREASARAKEALDSARGEAQAAGSEKLAAIRTEAEGEKNKQMADIHAQIDAARKELQEGASDFAREMAGKILGRSLEA